MIKVENEPSTPVFMSLLAPTGSHTAITMGANVYSPPISKDTKYMLVQAVTANIRFTLDGTNPTTTVGFQLVAADPPLLIPIAHGTAPKFTREASGAILQWLPMG